MREWLDDALARMRAAGHEPSPALLVRLTDGRLRILPPDEPEARLRRLSNECGPVELAYLVDGNGAVPVAGPASNDSYCDSSNWAIFAASLGMTTGALPNVGCSLVPSGAVKPPVW